MLDPEERERRDGGGGGDMTLCQKKKREERPTRHHSLQVILRAPDIILQRLSHTPVSPCLFVSCPPFPHDSHN